MRIKISFSGAPFLSLPIHYNHLVQAFIYNNLNKWLSEFYHEKGWSYHKRRFKLFTFSRLMGKNYKVNREKGEIVFKGKVCLKIGALDNRFLESFALNLIRAGSFKLGRNLCQIESIEVEQPKEGEGKTFLVRAISPITVYSTLKTPEGKKKTYFYNPFEKEFETQIFENLKRKARAYLGEESQFPELNHQSALIKPYQVSNRNEVIVNFKNFWIKGWLGLYKLRLPEPFFGIAYNSGLGSKNSQGFGMIEIIKELKE